MQGVPRIGLVLVVVMALGIYALNSVVDGADEQPPAERMERVQKAFDEAYLKGNLDALDELYEPDVVIHWLDQPDTIGLDAFKEIAKQNCLMFSDA